MYTHVCVCVCYVCILKLFLGETFKDLYTHMHTQTHKHINICLQFFSNLTIHCGYLKLSVHKIFLSFPKMAIQWPIYTPGMCHGKCKICICAWK